MKKRALVPLVGLLLALPPMPAEAANTGTFNVFCGYSHTLPDDPIVAPGQPGGSHLHDFLGNETVNANSRYRSMTAGSTTCALRTDTAGYWNPTAFIGKTRITANRLSAYYRGSTRPVTPYPKDLQMIAGNKDASSRAENPNVDWECTSNDRAPVSDHPFDCTPYGGRVAAKVVFPSCWNGPGLRPDDVAYPDGFDCARPFNVRLPRLIYRVRWQIQDPCLGAEPCSADRAPDENIRLSLSSGPFYTMHADFWNTWDQKALNDLVQRCLNARVNCGDQTDDNTRSRTPSRR